MKHLVKLELSWICESNWKNTPCIWAMEKGQISNNLSRGYVVSMCNFLSYHLVKNEKFLSHFSAVQCARVLDKIWQHLEVMVETGKPRLFYLLYRYVYNADFIYIKIIAIKNFWPSPSPISWFFFFFPWPFSLHFSRHSYLFIITLSDSSRTELMISNLTAVLKFYCKASKGSLFLSDPHFHF